MKTLHVTRQKRFSTRSFIVKNGPISVAIVWLPSLLRPAEAVIGQSRFTFTRRLMANHYVVRNDKGDTVATYMAGRRKGGLLKTCLGLAYRTTVIAIGNVKYEFEPHLSTYYTWTRLSQPDTPITPIMHYAFYRDAERAQGIVKIGDGIITSHSEILTVVGLELALKRRSIRP